MERDASTGKNLSRLSHREVAVVQNSHESGLKYWTTRSSVRLFDRSLTHSRVSGKENDSISQNDLVLSHSVSIVHCAFI